MSHSQFCKPITLAARASGFRGLMNQRSLKALLVLCCAVIAVPLSAAETEIPTTKIWDTAPHSAFTDLARFSGKWFCVFRESAGHVAAGGKIRIIVSEDGENWSSAALLAEDGIDLRDPKLCTTPDGRLMLTLGGTIYRGGKTVLGHQPRVSFSQDGREWSTPQPVLKEGDWLWRVTWHDGIAYGVSYTTGAKTDSQVALYRSSDGLAWELVAPLTVPDQPNETTLQFEPDGAAVALVRREAGDKHGWLGHAEAPYTKWTWQSIGRFIGGPNFLILPDGRLLAAGRDLSAAGPRTAVGYLVDGAWKIDHLLPSGGDTSYPGMVLHEGVVWLSYYSSHEGKSAIYLAKLPIEKGKDSR